MLNEKTSRIQDSQFSLQGDITILQRIDNYNNNKQKNKEFIIGMFLGLFLNFFSFFTLLFFKSKHLK